MGTREKILWWATKRRVAIDKPYIIAIGGGIAKTSTKVILGEVLKLAFPGQVRVGYGNLNTFIGVPLAALGFNVDFHKQRIGIFGWILILKMAILKGFFSKLPKYLILEYGTDQPGDIEKLVGTLPPDMALLTIITEAHVANYGSMEKVAQDESRLVAAVKAEGTVIINKKDSYIGQYRTEIIAKKIVEVDTVPELIARNFASAAAKVLGINDEIIKQALSKPIAASGRFEIKKLDKYHLIDDSYNANPASMEAALNVLAKSPGRKIAVLGTMLELGEDAEKLHKRVGEKAGKVADVVIGVGDMAQNYHPTKIFPNSELAAQGIFTYIREGDSILVKGSRGVRMEKIVEGIVNHGI